MISVQEIRTFTQSESLLSDGPQLQTLPASTLEIARRPALVMGVGGSGHRVVLHLKHAMGGVPNPWVKLMVLDSAHEDLRLSLNGREVRMEPGSELIYIGDVAVPAIMRNLNHLTILKETFGEKLRQLPRVTYRDGVAGNRTAGQLSFHYHLARIEKDIASRLRALSRHEGAASDSLVQSTGLNIILTGSACGGQGSGAMLDLAYLMRELLAELGQLADNSMITGVFLLPDAFPGLQNRYLEPNTVEFLQEIEHYMDAGGYQVTFPNQREIESVESPFDRVFLIGGVDQRGRTRSSLAEVTAVAGQILYLLHGTPAGQKLENDFFNFSGVLSQRTHSGELACFGSLGLAVLEADGERLQRLATRQFALEVIDQALLPSPHLPAVQQAVEDFENQTQLAFSPLQQALMQDPDGGQVVVDAALPAHIRNQDHETLASAVDAYYRQYRQFQLVQYVAAVVDANANDRVQAAKQILEQTLNDATSHHGVPQALALVQAISKRLRHQHQLWYETWQTHRSQLEDAEAAFEQAGRALFKATEQIFFMRKRAVESALVRVDRSAQALADAYLAHRIAEDAVNALAEIDRLVRSHEQRLRHVERRLMQARQVLANDMSIHRDSENTLPPDIDLIDDDLVRYWYAQTSPQPEAGRNQVLRHAAEQGLPLQRWDELQPEQLAELMISGLQKTFQHLAEMSVEDIIEDQKDRISPERWQSRLLEMAVPMCNLEAVRLVDGDVQPVTVAVMGVEDDRETIFDQNPEMIVATQDKKRLVALVALLGFPLSALKQWPAWERSYRRFHGR